MSCISRPNLRITSETNTMERKYEYRAYGRSSTMHVNILEMATVRQRMVEPKNGELCHSLHLLQLISH